MKVARTVWTYTKSVRIVRDGEEAVTITAKDVDTKIDVAGLVAIKVDFPEGVSDVKVVKVGTRTFDTDNSLEDGKYKNFPGNLEDAITFSFIVDGEAKTVEITK